MELRGWGGWVGRVAGSRQGGCGGERQGGEGVWGGTGRLERGGVGGLGGAGQDREGWRRADMGGLGWEGWVELTGWGGG